MNRWLVFTRAACAQLLLLFVGVGCVRAGDVAGLIAVPKLPLPASADFARTRNRALRPLPDSLTAEQVWTTVDAHRDALQRCYDEWLARHPLRGNAMFAVHVSLAIAPDGRSEQMALRGLDEQPPLATCIEAELSQWRFPRSQLGADLRVPLVLAGRRREDNKLSPRALHDTMIAQRASLTPCFERVEGALPAMSASLSIDANGKTRVAQLRGVDRQPKLKTCLRDALLAWHFPPATGFEIFAFPLALD